VVRVGEKHKMDNIILEITSVESIFKFRNTELLRIGYVLIDGNYRSPEGYFFIRKEEDVRNAIERVIRNYKSVRDYIAGSLRR